VCQKQSCHSTPSIQGGAIPSHDHATFRSAFRVVLVPYVLSKYAKVGKKVTSSIFFLTNCNYSYNEVYKYHKHILYKVDIIFPQSLLPLVRETLYAGRVKLYAEASELLTHAVSARRLPKNCLFGVQPSGVQKGGSRRVLNGECREDEGRQIQGADF